MNKRYFSYNRFIIIMVADIFMFTGIIEETGFIRSIKSGKDSCTLTVQANKVLEDVNIGDSIAVSGICLTVTDYDNVSFCVDVMHETLNRTILADISVGSRVNLERAMPANGRFGGHIVSGHIDGTGKVKSVREDDNAVIYEISAEENVLNYVVEKGSITIDGISLTVVSVDDEKFSVSVIPHTRKMTTLSQKKVGDKVNLECDIIGKYVEKMMINQSKESASKKSNIDEDFLADNGFI